MCLSRYVLTLACIASVGCATQQPTAQAPQLSRENEIGAFEAVLRHKLAIVRTPHGSTVAVQALEIFPPAYHSSPAPVQALSHRIRDFHVAVSSEFRPAAHWCIVILNSIEGDVLYFSVQDNHAVNTFRVAKRAGHWVVLGVDPVVLA